MRVVVMEHEQAVRFDRGRLAGVLGPGRHRVRRRRHRVEVFDLRSRIQTVPGQEILTADGASVRLTLAATTRIVDPVAMLRATQSAVEEIHLALQIAVRDAVAELDLAATVAARATLGPRIAEVVAPQAAGFGVELVAVAVKDVMLPAELRRAFADVVTARQQGLAALERARGETAALRSLANAARLAESTPGLMQLRTLQVAETARTTLVLGPGGAVVATATEVPPPQSPLQAPA